MIIGLTGRAQHGKDATGQYLVDNFAFKRYAFADQLKSMALALNPFVDREMKLRLYTVVQDRGWDDAKTEIPEVRRFLQVLGTEAVRDHLGEDAWVEALAKRLTEDEFFPKKEGNVVITDVRFPNEADWLRDVGGELWRIRRMNLDGTVFDNGLGADHPSEAHVDRLVVDREVIATTLDDLYIKVRTALLPR